MCCFEIRCAGFKRSYGRGFHENKSKTSAPSVRRAMFIDANRNAGCALRQEGHVYGEGRTLGSTLPSWRRARSLAAVSINMALLTEGNPEFEVPITHGRV